MSSRPALDSIDTAEGRLIMASNRGPLEYYVDNMGRLAHRCASGGVATALASLTPGTPITWIASAANEAERNLAHQGSHLDLGDDKRLRLVEPAADAYDLFYGTFCNPILWFLQHSIWERLSDERDVVDAWERGYLSVNQTFAEAIAEELERDDSSGRVMLHDYHLYAAPLFIRNLHPGAVLQHFIHIPWPEPEHWSHLPPSIVESICEGLLANDSVAFQTERSARAFVRTCQTYLGAMRTNADETLLTRSGHATRLWWNPISVDIWDLRTQLAAPEAAGYAAQFENDDVRTIVRVDRLDPSKNAGVGFRAFERMLTSHPEWVGKVRFLAFLIPSRDNIAEYCAYQREVFAQVKAVNARFAYPGWTPIEVYHEHNRTQALAAMRRYDVLLVNPLADGMNLVSKEGPAVNERNGVLALSNRAGSFAELGDAAVAVEPADVDGTAEALHRALTMPADERAQRAQRLRQAVVRHGLARWLQLLLEDLGFDPRPTAPAAQRGAWN